MDIYVWGSNKFKQLSSKSELHFYQPTANLDFDGQSISQVSTGLSWVELAMVIVFIKILVPFQETVTLFF